MKSNTVFAKIISTGEVLRFNSIREAAVQLGLSASMVTRTCQNENQPCLQTNKGLVLLIEEGSTFRKLTDLEKETIPKKNKNTNWYINEREEVVINIDNIAFMSRKDINEYEVAMSGTNHSLIVDHRVYQEIINHIKERKDNGNH